MRRYPVVEIFQSIQGEGIYSGMPVNFIRLAGCPLACDFCDTDYAPREKLTSFEIVSKLNPQFPTAVITGGEPTAHKLSELVGELRDSAYRVHLETSGIHAFPSGIDFVSVSPKKGHKLRFHKRSMLEVKWLVPMWSFEEIDWNLSHIHFVQPINYDKEVNYNNVKRCLQILMNAPTLPTKSLRLSIQLHKVVGAR